MLSLHEDVQVTAGVVLLTVVTIESGGVFLLRIMGQQAGVTPFQRAFFRAGHAHAGVLVTLGLVCLVLSTAVDMSGLVGFFGQFGVLCAAVVIPAGFFFSAIGHERRSPSRWIYLLYAGAVLLAVSLVTLGIALIAGA